jgi:hypothetical protein
VTRPTITLGEIQAATWANKLAKGFDTSNVNQEFNLLNAEIYEAYEARSAGDQPGLAGEFADVAIFLAGVAQMIGVDLHAAVAVLLGRPGGLSLREHQAVVAAYDRGQVVDVERAFNFLRNNIARAYDKWRHGETPAVQLALAVDDLVRLTRAADVDLEQAVINKLAVNAQRTYVRAPDGVLVKDPTVMPDTH